MRNQRAVKLVVLAVGVLFAAGAFGQSKGVYKKFKKQIVVSDQEIPVMDDDRAMIKALTKVRKAAIVRAEGSTSWVFYFMAFLSKKPGEGQLTVAFYEGKGASRKMATYKDIGVDPEGTIVATDFEISEDDGIKPGTTYEMSITDSAGKVVLATTKVTLK